MEQKVVSGKFKDIVENKKDVDEIINAMEVNSEQIEKAVVQGQRWVRNICKVKGYDGASGDEGDQEVLEKCVGKRVREMVDYCLEVDVGLEKKQKLGDQEVMEEIESRKAQAMQQRENDAQQDLELKQTQKIKLILEQEALAKKKEAELER